MNRLCSVALCLLAAACSTKAPEHAAVNSTSVVIVAAPDEQSSSDNTPAPSSNEGPAPAAEPDEDGSEDEEEDHGPPPLWGMPSGPPGAVGGPICDQAADCCLKILSATSPNSSLTQTCDTFRNAPTSACQGLLTALGQSAPQLGVACP